MEISEKQIGRYKYRVRKLDPWRGADLVHDILSTIAPAASGAIGALLSKSTNVSDIMDGMDEESAKNLGERLQESIETIFKTFTKAKQREWMEMMRDCSTVIIEDREPELKNVFNEHFRGHLKEMYEWLFFAIKSQCDDFLDGTDGAISRVVRSLQTMGSKSPTS